MVIRQSTSNKTVTQLKRSRKLSSFKREAKLVINFCCCEIISAASPRQCQGLAGGGVFQEEEEEEDARSRKRKER